MPTQKAPEHLRDQALSLLARREHGSHELINKLMLKGAKAEAAQNIVQALNEQGLASDQRFVSSFVYARTQRGHGPMKIRAELRQRKINDILIDQGLSEYTSKWPQILRQTWGKKYKQQYPTTHQQKATQIRFLQGRGFTAEQIHQLFDALTTPE